jgi:hypothetical protein
VIAATIVVGCALAPAAGARVLFDKTTRQWFGIVPPPPPPPQFNAGQSPLRPLPASGTPTCDTTVDSHCATPLALHGGLVQHAQNDILFFWDPNSFSGETGYVSDMQTWLSSVAAGDYSTGNTSSAVGNPLSVNQEYYDMSGPGATKNFVPYAVKNAGTIMDTHPYPTKQCTDSYPDYYSVPNPPYPTVTLTGCVTAGQLFAELNSYITAHHLARGINTQYFILTPPGVGSCDDTTSHVCGIAQYCGWHSFAGSSASPSSQTVFANMPWLQGTNCDVNRALRGYGGSGYPDLHSTGIDSVVGVFSHELSETMTDPNPPSGWFGGGGLSDEIGDKCSYQYVVGSPYYTLTGLPTTGGGAYYNTTLNSNNYLLQMEYDNRAGGCNQWNTDTQPTATISAPAHPVSGTPASFSLTNVTTSGNVGIAYVNWSFGDGTTGRSTGTAAISHTYGVGGAKTVTAIVTDNHGNEVQKTAPVTVTQGPASIAVKLNTQHPAPKGLFTVKVSGFAIPGGTLGSGGHSTEVDLYEQTGATCATTRKAEQSKVASGSTVRAAQWFVAAGAFAQSGQGHAVAGQHHTVHLCGYVSRSASVTDARASTFYTTT